MTLAFSIPGLQVARRGQGAFLQWKAEIRAAARRQYCGHVIGAPVRVVIAVSMPVPNSLTARQKRDVGIGMVVGYAERPGMQSLTEVLLTALTDAIWRDAALVYWLSAVKQYGETPGIMVAIEWDEEGR